VTDQNDQQDDDIYVIDESGDVVSGDPDPEEVSGLDISPESQPNAAASPDKEALAKELRELKDQYLRSRADFENFRRRNEREKSDYFRHALSGVMRELLPVVDNFERALASGAEGGEDFRKGIELIARQFVDVLQKQGLRAVEESGVAFDPTIHEAITSEEKPDVPANTVVEVFQKGYFLNDRLVRPALVKVSTGGPSGGQQ
jgi:molecular chaperone GrpE